MRELVNPVAALARVAAADMAANNGSLSTEIFVMTVAGLAAQAEIAEVEADRRALVAGVRDGHIQIVVVT